MGLERNVVVIDRFRGCVLVTLLLAMAAAPAQAEVRWKVLESSESVLRLRLETAGARLVEVPSPAGQAQTWSRVELDGAHASGSPGLPLVPGVGRWVACPPEGEPQLTFRVLERRSLGRARLLPHPVAELDENALPDEPRLKELSVEGEGYAQYRSAEAGVVRLQSPVFQRRQRMAALQFLPLIHDASTGETAVVEAVEVEIRFPRAKASSPDVARVGAGAGVLNPEMAARWRCLPPALQAKAQSWAGGSGPRPTLGKAVSGVGTFDGASLQGSEVRLRVDATAMVRVNVSALIDEGLATGVSRRNLRLYQRRPNDPLSPDYPRPLVADVPFTFLGNVDPDSTISPSDVIAFHAFSPADDWVARTIDGDAWPRAMEQRPDNYNTGNVYFVAMMTPGAEPWARMETETLGASTGSPQASFLQHQTFTGDVSYQDNPVNASVERFHWTNWLDSDVGRAVPLNHPAPGANVAVTWSTTRKVLDGRSVSFRLEKDGNQWPLGTVVLTSLYDQLWDNTVSVPADPIGHGFVRLVMERLVGGVPSTVGASLGRIELEYRALYQAEFNELDFHTDTVGGTVDVEVTDYSDSNVLVFDITDPRAPKRILTTAANVVDAGDGTFTLSLNVPQASGEQRRFFAGRRTNVDLVRTSDIEADPVADLFDGVGATQVLAVGPEMLRTEAQRWVDWRQQHNPYGWNVAFFDVQQIYDQFSGGLQAPIAIKRFAEYAYLQWNAAALVLMGDANEDARDLTELAGPNLVPPSLHVQTTFTDTRELLVSDKWYGVFGDFPDYPQDLDVTSDIMVGRFCVNGPTQLRATVDKILSYEQPRATDAWRTRTLWFSDDAYSSDYLGAGSGCYRLHSSELAFESSQHRNRDVVAGALGGRLTGETWDLDDATAPCRVEPPGECEQLSSVVQCASGSPVGDLYLFQQLSQGWLLVSYQGHANYKSLAHEAIFTRDSAQQLSNGGRPFLFLGMGCHISDFVYYREGRGQPSAFGYSVGEQLALSATAGAIATYGSSGFEFLTPNRIFTEVITDVMFDEGRTSGPIANASPEVMPWMLGEVMAQAEQDIFATPGVSARDEMISQYNILGDPTVRMDAAPPSLSAQAGGSAISPGALLEADAGSPNVALDLSLVDETGISRLEIHDTLGRDYASAVNLDAATDPRTRTGSVALPIYPQTYDVQLDLYDGAYFDARPTTVVYSVAVEKQISIDGVSREVEDVIVPTDRTVPVSATLVTPVDLVAQDIGVTMDGGNVTNLSVSGSGRNWTLNFDAQATSTATQTLLFELQPGVVEPEELVGAALASLALGTHFPMPNPARGDQPINFVVQSNDSVEDARLTVYDLSGRAIYSEDLSVQAEQASGESVRFVVQWNGRDGKGDEIANGTYLYRIEARRGNDSAKTEMGRIVMMR